MKSLIESLFQDVRFALRTLAASPGFTLVAVVTLTLGIGANTAIFSLVHGILLDPLPYRQGDQLVVVRQQAPKAELNNVLFSVKEVYDYRDENQSLSDLVEHHSMTFTLLGRDAPERVSVGVVSADFFQALGVTPVEGRSFLPEDDDLGAEAVLILSHKYWQQGFGADPEIIGKSFEMNDRPHTVVGVLPAIPQFPVEHDVYMPTSACPFRANGERNMEENRSAFRAMTVFGRVKDGASIDSVQADLSTIAARFEQQFPETYRPERGYAVQALPLQEELTRGARPTLFMLIATAALVLLIGCVNVANLFIARMMRRSKEVAIRTSLGAPRLRLMQQTLVESTLVAMAGGAAGLAVAFWLLDLLIPFAARFTPRAVEIEINGWVLGFTFLVSLITGVAFGLLPALQGDGKLVETLRQGGSSTQGVNRARVRGALVAVEVAVATVLLVTAGAMVQSLYRLSQVDLGFSSENVITARLARNWSRYQNLNDANRFLGSLLREVRSLPGVESAAVANARPLAGQQPFTTGLSIDNRRLEEGELVPQVVIRNASPDYFRTMGIDLVKGRTFTDADDADAPAVAVINRSLAKELFSDQEPIGRRVSTDNGNSWITVVGIVGDVRQQGLETEPVAAMYGAQAQTFWAQTLVVRTRLQPPALIPSLEAVVRRIDPEQPIDSFETMEQTRHAAMASPRLTVWLLGMFAALALAITATGITGVVAYSVSQRVQEIGIRLALGAPRMQVVWMILHQGIWLVVAGLIAGYAGAMFMRRFTSELLFETRASDPATIAGVGLILIVVSVLACLIPAWRAAHTSPTLALRAE